jgi:hypothetical protein
MEAMRRRRFEVRRVFAEKEERSEGVGGVAAYDDPIDCPMPLWWAKRSDAGDPLNWDPKPALGENALGELYELARPEKSCDDENGMEEDESRDEDMMSMPLSRC